MRARATAILATLMLAASPVLATTDVPTVVVDLTAMNETDVRALLSDVEIGPPCCDMAELFYHDGSYVYLGFGPDRGHFTVSGNHVCVTTKSRPDERCRRIYRDRQGEPVFINDGDRRAEPISPRPAPDISHWR